MNASTKTAGSKNGFLPWFEFCPTHGKWQSNVLDERGDVRWLSSCPVCAQDRISAELVQRAGIPPRFADRTLGTFEASTPEQLSARNIAADYIERFEDYRQRGSSLVFVGNPGTGKTHLAVGVTRELMCRGHSGMFARAYEIIGAIRASWSRSDQDENDVISAFAAVDLLIIDEVGVQYGKESEQVELFKVINRRYDLKAPMIVISNCNLEGLESYLGPRSYDRLREGGGRAVVFDWESHRRKL